MNDEFKARFNSLLDGIIKLELMKNLPDEVLAYLAQAESNPFEESYEKLGRYYNDVANHLQARAENFRPAVAQQPAQPESRLENFVVPSNLVN